ncbi:hypothetical protein VTH06DRAFT_881 [Thermothelomyces fergusii]
MLFAYFL